MNFSARAKEVVILKPCTEEKERYAFIIESISCYIANNIIIIHMLLLLLLLLFPTTNSQELTTSRTEGLSLRLPMFFCRSANRELVHSPPSSA